MTTPWQYFGETVTGIRGVHDWIKLSLRDDDTAAPEERWAPVEAFSTPETRDQGTVDLQEHYRQYYEVTRPIAGNFLFREIVYAPLLVAGYAFARDRRVPSLRGAFELRLDQMGPVRVTAARLAVLPGDALAGAEDVEVVPDLATLTERLFSETGLLCSPILKTFAEVKYVATANAWGSMLDALIDGFTTAASDGLGLDEAWSRWDAAIEDRTFPVRRRPRRMPYEWPGGQDEETVRAGCCLYYMTDEAKKQPDERYCSSCYLETDENRTRRMIEWKEQVASGEGAHD